MSPELISSISAIGQILGALSAIAAIATFYWSNVRLPARRLGIVDLATKQLAFWKQALELELSATTDLVRQQAARDRADAALQRIRAHADCELERMAWAERTSAQIFQSRKTLLRLKWPPSLTNSQKLTWAMYKLFCWAFLLSALVTGMFLATRIILHPTPAKANTRLLAVIYCYTLLWAARFYGLAAESMAYPAKPHSPVLDKI